MADLVHASAFRLACLHCARGPEGILPRPRNGKRMEARHDGKSYWGACRSSGSTVAMVFWDMFPAMVSTTRGRSTIDPTK